MARKTCIENYRVEVIPEPVIGVIYLSATQPTEEEKLRRRCEEIRTAIKRHIDDVSDCYVICDRSHVCEHCGAKWTERDTVYNGGCCDKDEAANPDARAA